MNKLFFSFIFFFSFISNSFGQFQTLWEWKPMGAPIGTYLAVYNDDRSDYESFSFNWEGHHVKYARSDSRSIEGNREEFSIFLQNCQTLLETKGSKGDCTLSGYNITYEKGSIVIKTSGGWNEGFITKSNLKKMVKAFNSYISSNNFN